MTACGSVCVRVKCSLTLSTCLRNELAFQQNACKTGQEVSSAKRLALVLAVLVQDASMRGAVVECVRDKVHDVRDADSDDDVIRKPSRCWLGAVPKYWNVVASCFRFISFAENTSAALAPRAGISQPILLLFFCFLALEFFYKMLPQIFFIRSQNLVAFERRQD